MAETIRSGVDSPGEDGVVAADLVDIQVESIIDSPEGQNRTPRERIGDLIRRMQVTGSRKLIPDATAEEVVRGALFWHA